MADRCVIVRIVKKQINKKQGGNLYDAIGVY